MPSSSLSSSAALQLAGADALAHGVVVENGRIEHVFDGIEPV
jgi:hypothetical protein